MAAIEDRPLQPPLNEVEEDRALLLHTHQDWRRSQQDGIRKKRQSEDEQSAHTAPPSSQDFFQIDLREADFRHKDLRNANFQEAYLPGANFEGANLRGANFQGANLRSVRFRGAQLAWANFSQADLIWADFQHADLQGTDFQHATLRGATFVRAQIRGGTFLARTAPGPIFKTLTCMKAISNRPISMERPSSIPRQRVLISKIVLGTTNLQRLNFPHPPVIRFFLNGLF